MRQWCAFELIRAYGFRITDIEFERTVRVGSKQYRIDVLVLKEEQPWIVVECKEPDDADMEAALEQAISYGVPQQIGAEFVVATNGKSWSVKRKVGGSFVPVVDLPKNVHFRTGNEIVDMVQTLEATLPLLHRLDTMVEGKDAQRFLSAMVTFFQGGHQLTHGASLELLSAIEDIVHALLLPEREKDYVYRIRTAFENFERFRKYSNLGHELYFDVAEDRPVYEHLRRLHIAVGYLLPSTLAIPGLNAFLIRVGAAILENGMALTHPKKPEQRILPVVHSALREYLTYSMAVALDFHLPDPLNRSNVSQLRSYSKDAWERVELEE